MQNRYKFDKSNNSLLFSKKNLYCFLKIIVFYNNFLVPLLLFRHGFELFYLFIFSPFSVPLVLPPDPLLILQICWKIVTNSSIRPWIGLFTLHEATFWWFLLVFAHFFPALTRDKRIMTDVGDQFSFHFLSPPTHPSHCFDVIFGIFVMKILNFGKSNN